MGIIDQAGADLRATSSHNRFAAMDGLRGLAALAVVLYHSLSRQIVINGSLAVDFFFILSGFVIAYSYEPRLELGMTAKRFLLNRFVRLYPMAFIATAVGVAIALVHNKTNPAAAYPIRSMLTSGSLSFVLLPYLGKNISDEVFSFDPPMWSLFFEAIANIIYIATRNRLKKPYLVLIIIIGLIGVVYIGPLGGDRKENILGGLPRVCAGFFGGVLLFRLWSEGRITHIRSNIFVLGVVLAVVLFFPYELVGFYYLPAYVIMWLTVLASAGARSSNSDKISEFLGDVSYPIYVTHWLTLYVFTYVCAKMGMRGNLYEMVPFIHLALVPLFGFAIGHYYEKPVRQFLRRKLLVVRT